MICEPFETEDLPTFLLLAEEEGWICDREEFRFILQKSPQGSFVARSSDGAVQGFITSLAYQRSGWIGNLIVRPDQRRNGIGSLLMGRCMEALASSGVRTVWLTASSSGAPLYERLGFRPIDRIVRWRLEGALLSNPKNNEAESKIHDLLRIDRYGWGDDRATLCRHKIGQGRLLSSSGCAMVIQKLDSGALIGPWGADSPKTAEFCIQTALYSGVASGSTFADVPGSNSPAGCLLETFGFDICGETVLMYCGDTPEYRPEVIFALASAGSIG